MVRKKEERKTCQTLTVTASYPLAEGVYSLTLKYPAGSAPREVRPGQFVGVYTQDLSALLPRPISICGWDMDTGQLRLVYRVVGKGTAQFAGLRPGDPLRVLGVLGNGYEVSALAGKRVLLLGGGIGAPPLLGLAQALQTANEPSADGPLLSNSAAEERTPVVSGINRSRNTMESAEETNVGRPREAAGRITSVMGYRTNDLFLTEEFSAAGQLIIATDDGTIGFHGNAVEAAKSLIPEGAPCSFDVICACGPLPMLRGVKALAQEWAIPAFLSLEERMACGVGACLGCVTKTTAIDVHSHVRNARICTEGPVFPAEDVIL